MSWDEVWTVNSGAKVLQHDKVFIMDDLRVQAKRYPAYAELLKSHDKPIITSTPYEEFPYSVAYPIREVVDLIGETAWLNNTVVYAIAYALYSGVKVLHLYGADFYYTNMTRREEGAQAAAYMIGMCKEKGMVCALPSTTTLLATGQIRAVEGHHYRPLYGYMKHPLIKDDNLADAMQKDQECRKGDEPRNLYTKPLEQFVPLPKANGQIVERG